MPNASASGTQWLTACLDGVKPPCLKCLGYAELEGAGGTILRAFLAHENAAKLQTALDAVHESAAG